jgi:hypothetical protein
MRRAVRSGCPLLLVAVACAPALSPRPGPDPGAAETPPPLGSAPTATAWTVRSGVEFTTSDGGVHPIAAPFTAVQTLGRDSAGIVVRCGPPCPEPGEGRVAEGDLVFEALPPEVAAWGELGEFALAVREAAARRDVQALRGVMNPEFTHGFIGIQTPEIASLVWESEEFASLDRVPELLDRGLASLDGRIWSAPPEFVEDREYRGLRLGFRRRPDGRWEWIYLIQGIVAGGR